MLFLLLKIREKGSFAAIYVREETFMGERETKRIGRLRSWVDRLTALVLVLVMAMSACLVEAGAVAWNPNAESKDNFSQLRFWEDEAPGVRFYINAAARYKLETTETPEFGSVDGEWMIMDLLRGMYMGLDYMNYIPDGYFSGYYSRVEQKVLELGGELDRNKCTEWCRAMLAFSAMGKDPADVAGYDFIDKLSQSYAFSYRQGLNGPIWQLIAMDTAGYEYYTEPSKYNEGDINTRGKMIDYIVRSEIKDSKETIGGWALNLQAAQQNGADADITGMALQALAPYYLDAGKYKAAGAQTPWSEFVQMVERGIYSLYQMQDRCGGFGGWGSSINAESTAQVLVALCALGIDPKSESVTLENIDKKARFLTPGGLLDDVRTNNMVDALLAFWEKNSGSSEAVGGFKHVTSGNDGGGGAGYVVNAMATEQAIYALTAYDRYLNGENSLYDMTDMADGSYIQMIPASYKVTYQNGDGTLETADYAPYAEVVIPIGKDKKEESFVSWNTKPDGSGTAYQPNEVLSMPEQEITLYAQYGETEFSLRLELNGGALADGVTVPSVYTPFDDDIALPGAEEVIREGYAFGGWYADSKFSGSPVTAVTRGSYGDKVLYARWQTYYENIRMFGACIAKLKPGSIKVADSTTIKKARTLYDGMTAAEKEDAGCQYYYKILIQAEAELEKLLENTKAADIVAAMIDELSDITLEQQDAVTEAREAYEALSDEEKELVVNYAGLMAAEEQIGLLLADKASADEAIALIKAIGEVTLDSEQAVADARDAYNALTEQQRGMVDAYYERQLESAEETLTKLQERDARIQNVNELISLIPEELSLEDDSFQIVSDAKAAYVALTDDERAEIPAESRDMVDAALRALERLANEVITDEEYEAARQVELDISYFSGEITLEEEEELRQVREAYDALTNVQKAVVTTYYSLVQLELELQQLHADAEAAAEVDEMILQIGEVTPDSEEYIASVRRAYLHLTSAQKQLVQNLSVLRAAEQTLSGLKYDYQRAQETIKKINEIGEVTLKSKDRILRAEAAYNTMTDAQKLYVSAEQLKVLTDARAAYDKLYALVLKEIALDKTEVTLQPAETAELKVTYNPEDTTSDKTVVWKSSNEEVATVEDGVITAVGNGEAAVVAMVGNVSAICAVHVETPLAGITISRETLKLAKGEFEYLSVGYLPETTTDDPVVEWSSSNPKAVAVNADGKVTASAGGSAVITAKVGKFTASCKVTAYEYRLSYTLNGGTNNSENTPGYSGNWTITLKAPERKGYTFGGWYTDSKYKNKITTIKKGTKKNYTLYAKWVKVTAPGKPVISSLTNTAANSMKVALKGKVSGAAAYEICYADNSSMKNAESIYTTAYKGRTIKPLTTGKTYYVKVRAYKKDSTGAKVYGSYSAAKKVTLAIPATPWIKTLTNSASKTMTVGLSREIYGTYGYQIVCATNSKFTAGKKTVSTTAVSKKITGLQKGKTYYVKVRAMTKINGKNTFGAYSSVKKMYIAK